MILFMNNIKRILREKSNIITMLVVPIAFMAMVLVMNSSGGYELRVGFVDYDQTVLTQELYKKLQQKSIVIMKTEENLQQDLIEMKLDYALIIPKGFTQELIANKNPQIQGIRIKETNVTIPTTLYIENFINGVKNIAKAAAGDEYVFYQGIKVYQEGPLRLKDTKIEAEDNTGRITLAGLGFLVMSMLFFSTFSTNMILMDRENKTFYRVLSGPIMIKRYMFENLLSFLFLSQLQIIIVFSIMKWILKMNLGPSTFSLYLVLLVFSFVCVSFGIALTSLANDRRQASSTASFLITPMVMLGGGFWPREIMPQLLQKAGNFVPVTWVLKAADKVLYGSSLKEIFLEISILLLFSLIFFLMGTWRKSDIIQ